MRGPASGAAGAAARSGRDSGSAVVAGRRIRVRVRPGARRTAVGGRWDGAWPGATSPPDASMQAALVVAVTAPAVDGRANAAVCAALAAALGVRDRQVRIVSGERSRHKVVEIAGAPADLADRISGLLAG